MNQTVENKHQFILCGVIIGIEELRNVDSVIIVERYSIFQADFFICIVVSAQICQFAHGKDYVALVFETFDGFQPAIISAPSRNGVTIIVDIFGIIAHKEEHNLDIIAGISGIYDISAIKGDIGIEATVVIIERDASDAEQFGSCPYISIKGDFENIRVFVEFSLGNLWRLS